MDGEPGRYWMTCPGGEPDDAGAVTMMSSPPSPARRTVSNRKSSQAAAGGCWWLLRRRQSASANYSSMLLISVPTNETSAGRADSVGKSRELQKDSGGPVLAPKLSSPQSLAHAPQTLAAGIITDTPRADAEHRLPSRPFRWRRSTPRARCYPRPVSCIQQCCC